MNRIANAFDNGKAFIAFITCGDPDLETTAATVREAAKALCIGKSTVHKDVTERLKTINPGLYGMVRSVLNVNKAERHIRGGKATHDKYAILRQCAGDVTADR